MRRDRHSRQHGGLEGLLPATLASTPVGPRHWRRQRQDHEDQDGACPSYAPMAAVAMGGPSPWRVVDRCSTAAMEPGAWRRHRVVCNCLVVHSQGFAHNCPSMDCICRRHRVPAHVNARSSPTRHPGHSLVDQDVENQGEGIRAEALQGAINSDEVHHGVVHTWEMHWTEVDQDELRQAVVPCGGVGVHQNEADPARSLVHQGEAPNNAKSSAHAQISHLSDS